MLYLDVSTFTKSVRRFYVYSFSDFFDFLKTNEILDQYVFHDKFFLDITRESNPSTYVFTILTGR